MCGDTVDAILDQIELAELSATAYRTAVRLLRLARANDGQLRLSRQQAIELCGSESDATMRTHLYQMGRAGVVEYHAGADVFVRFLSWPLRAERANEVQEDVALRAQRANESSVNDIQALGFRAERVNLRAERALSGNSVTRARSGGWVGSLTNTRTRKKPTHPPDPNDPQQLALGLLVDREIGISYEVAQILAATLPALDIYRVVDEWLPEHREGKVQTGALVSRIRRLVPSDEPAVLLSVGFLRSELFDRHRLPAALIVDPERKRYSL